MAEQGIRIYNLFPSLVGSIPDWERHLDRIAAMGFDWIFVNPFHYPGFSGSIYAVKDYYVLNPLFQGSSKRSQDDLIKRFAAAAAKRGLSVMMDLVANHTSKDSVLVEQHPEWFLRETDGSVKSPFAVDPADTRKKTVWGDLAELDYSDRPERAKLIEYFCDVIRHYVKLGIKGFRCDAAYKVPNDAWQTYIRVGREADSDVLFVAENLGASLEEVEALRPAGFDYLFNSAKWWDFRKGWLLQQYEKFRSLAPSIAFPETHDTARLASDLAKGGIDHASELERRYRQMYLFSALFSTGVMIPIGYEFGFRRSLHVVDSRPDQWEKANFDISSYIAAVNAMKASVPVLNEEGPQRAIRKRGRALCLLRRETRGPGWAASVINVDHGSSAKFRLGDIGVAIDKAREVTPERVQTPLPPDGIVELASGEIRVFVGP